MLHQQYISTDVNLPVLDLMFGIAYNFLFARYFTETATEIKQLWQLPSRLGSVPDLLGLGAFPGRTVPVLEKQTHHNQYN